MYIVKMAADTGSITNNKITMIIINLFNSYFKKMCFCFLMLT